MKILEICNSSLTICNFSLAVRNCLLAIMKFFLQAFTFTFLARRFNILLTVFNLNQQVKIFRSTISLGVSMWWVIINCEKVNKNKRKSRRKKQSEKNFKYTYCVHHTTLSYYLSSRNWTTSRLKRKSASTRAATDVLEFKRTTLEGRKKIRHFDQLDMNS